MPARVNTPARPERFAGRHDPDQRAITGAAVEDLVAAVNFDQINLVVQAVDADVLGQVIELLPLDQRKQLGIGMEGECHQNGTSASSGRAPSEATSASTMLSSDGIRSRGVRLLQFNL